MATRMNWDRCRGHTVMVHSTYLSPVIGLYRVDVRIDTEYESEPTYCWTVARAKSHAEAFEIALARVANILMTGRLTMYGRTFRTFVTGTREM